MENVIKFIGENWALIATLLWCVSELLSMIPKVKANSIFQLVFNWLSTQKKLGKGE